jgi:hypothetical protein
VASQKGKGYTVLKNAQKTCDRNGSSYHVYDANGKEVYTGKELPAVKNDNIVIDIAK